MSSSVIKADKTMFSVGTPIKVGVTEGGGACPADNTYPNHFKLLITGLSR
ncbi:MAG: hypothetical protein KKC46_03210 [Proteobacteria bacterium]|nr:hypothetical protein [Pseudomonadota bacterium]